MCGSKDEMYRHLSVDVGDDSEHDPWTVERSLKQFFQPEKRELKSVQSSGRNSDEERQTVPPRMEMVLRKNELGKALLQCIAFVV
ncbi:hypothetical protein ACHAXA_009821 [Cyclostephanos tholiformis]|uniref:Uncharacterized protein n=1 Tax=Cyclostephanos tholiformis TaxID=382380 RepID=A0ABD3RDW1_9STRA